MRSPSTRVLNRRADIWPYDPTAIDADGASDPNACYPGATHRGIPCSAQCVKVEVKEDDQLRPTTLRTWTVLFNVDPGVTLRDRIDVRRLDRSLEASIQVSDPKNAGGRDGCWVVIGTENR